MEACHSPQQSNGTSYGATILAIITLEAFAGVWINAFIICVLVIGWVRKKTLNSNEKILLMLGFSRSWYFFFSWLYCSLSILYPNYLFVHLTFHLIVFFQSFLNCSNLWISACLCVFYCIKVANFRIRFFIYLKAKSDSIVPWLLLASVLSSLAIGIVAYDIADAKLGINQNSSGQGNFSKEISHMDVIFFQMYFIYSFGFFTSFTAVICSALLLLFSLWRHKCKMQKNSMNSISMDAHIKAMKSVLSFFIMYSINFIFLILSLSPSTKEEKHVALLSLLYLYAFPGVHSLILIFSNPKMEKTLIRIVSYVKCKVCMR